MKEKARTNVRDKLKIRYLMELLMEETDSQHLMNATQPCERLLCHKHHKLKKSEGKQKRGV